MIPTITKSDFKLRLFLDTNIIVDYFLGCDDSACKSFLDLFSNSAFKNIELVSCEYVLWEAYGVLKRELYSKDVIAKRMCSVRKAQSESDNFRNATLEDIKRYGDEIKKFKEKIEIIVQPKKLIGEKIDGFSDFVELLLQASKFSYTDSIIFAAALFSSSQVLLTCDEPFSETKHLETLREALKETHPAFQYFKFMSPKDFSDEGKAKESYKNWFEENIQDKKVGDIAHYFNNDKIIRITCTNLEYSFKKNDYICIAKFFDGDLVYYSFKIGLLRDYSSEREVEEGKDVTIQLPPECPDRNWTNGCVFYQNE